MKSILLAIAMAAGAVAASAAPHIQPVAPAVSGTNPVAAVPNMPEAKSPQCEMSVADLCRVTSAAEIPTIGLIPTAAESRPGKLAAFQESTPSTACDLASVYERYRFLSAPWSVKRRLDAAKAIGDAYEAEHMKRKLVEMLLKALDVGED